MSSIPPIETHNWPKGRPLPLFDDIVEVAAQGCGVQAWAVYGGGNVTRRDTQSTVARNIVYQIASSLLGMSGPEIIARLGVSSRGVFTSSRSHTYRLSHSHMGRAMVNEAIYCLRKLTDANPPSVERREQTAPPLIGDGDFRQAARQALRQRLDTRPDPA